MSTLEQPYRPVLQLKQIRHDTYYPIGEYLEALRREPGDTHCNKAVGLLLKRKGQF